MSLKHAHRSIGATTAAYPRKTLFKRYEFGFLERKIINIDKTDFMT